MLARSVRLAGAADLGWLVAWGVVSQPTSRVMMTAHVRVYLDMGCTLEVARVDVN
jgi:hypothetical protein